MLVRSNNRVPSGQLRFVRGRNSPELLDSTRSGFSSLLAAEPLLRVADTRERARGAGESCLRPPDLSVGLQRGGANQPGPTFPRSPGRITNRAAASLRSQPPILFFQRTAITLARFAFLTTNSYPQLVHGLAPGARLSKTPIPAKITRFCARGSELSTVKKARMRPPVKKFLFAASGFFSVCASERSRNRSPRARVRRSPAATGETHAAGARLPRAQIHVARITKKPSEADGFAK